MDGDVRHPRRVCETCVGRACDEVGRPLRFFNTGLSGGFVARLADDGIERESHECLIDGVRCRADEAYLGGIVVEVVAEGRPSAPVGSVGDRGAPAGSAQAKAWWSGMTNLVGPTDRQLVVISPRSDATADDLRRLGQVLALWKAEYEHARHIWGLADLLDGRPPRTPPVYLAVPVLITRFEERYEPVVLVYVAEGGDLKAAEATLWTRLTELRSRLAWFGSPDEYCDQRR
jgi:hypothetical protein